MLASKLNLSVASPLTDQFISSGTGSIRNSKSQDVCHIAFGSRVLGPPPLSGRRNNLRLSTEVGWRFGNLTHPRAGSADRLVGCGKKEGKKEREADYVPEVGL